MARGTVEIIHPLISYIAPAAPATRCPGTGQEPFLRPEIGFTPKWYRERLGISFGERWHNDPAYRRDTVVSMRGALRERFPGTGIGGTDQPDASLDLLTGTFGACNVAALYGVPILYWEDNWPICEQRYLSDEAVDHLQPPDLDQSPFFQGLLAQVEWIAAREGSVRGYINWQGVLNNAHRLRGEDLFLDLMTNVDRCHRLFDCVCTTMIDAAKRLHERQRATGFEVDFFTVSNCLVNMVSPELYEQCLLPYDLRIAEAFARIGIHNCAWTADPYMAAYARVPGLAYVDMGIESDLVRARELFPQARRAIMYRPTELAQKPMDVIRADLERIARDYGSCDIVAADIESDTPDERVRSFMALCRELTEGESTKGT
ncbi:MAG: hypothetical protein HYZ00_07385 [Candidatus Hydrogenedentes bacterium]|nr:hypothetical protein [Candidatus Hydrogenedentota bacterium]